MKFALVASIGMLGSANAWWGTGHLLVARIAYDLLSKESPDQLAKAEKILGNLNNSVTSKKEKYHRFVECATYADDFKYHGGFYQKTWHFIDQPYYDQGGGASKYPDFKPDEHNSVEALEGLIDWMNNYSASNYPVNTVKAAGGSAKETYSTALRLIIHYVGDIHQPLHSVSRVDDSYKAGDRGGNSVRLPSKDGASNLHAVWDAVAY